MKDYYKVLEVNETASTEVIQAAYKILAKKYHPDHAKEHEKPIKEAKMKEINCAKEILLDPKKREMYDIQLRQEKRKLEEIAQKNKATYYGDTVNTNPPPRRQTQQRTAPPQKKETFKSKWRRFFEKEGSITTAIICLTMFFVAVLNVAIVIPWALGTGEKDSKPETVVVSGKILEEGISKQKVIDMFGIPDYESEATLKHDDNKIITVMEYDSAKVLISDDLVVGWIDTYNELNFRKHTEQPQLEDVSIGMEKSGIIKVWGMPDTYSPDMIVYNDLIIHFNDNRVIKVEAQGK